MGWISIHALREEGDANRMEMELPYHISIHALREEGDMGVPTKCIGATDFYPRPPRGGRPVICKFRLEDYHISIHALREEGDSKNREKTLCFCLIIHLSAQIAKRCL